MYRPQHSILTSDSVRMSRPRMIGTGLMIAIHVAFIWAVVNGLAMKITKYVEPVLEAQVILSEPQTPQIAPPKPQLVQPQNPQAIAPPDIVIAPPAPQQTIAAPLAAPVVAVPDSSASGVVSTHTTPPYPPLARSLGQQGTVILALTISAAGDVTNAQVATSSGVPELDQTAVTWVTAHWKYKPAIQNGVPVPSTTQAEVVFNLKNAH